MLTNDIEWETVRPPDELTHFVESFWMLANRSDTAHQIIILPDGRFDIIFSFTDHDIYEPVLKGLNIEPEQRTLPAATSYCAISFKQLAVEYLLDESVRTLLNKGINVGTDFWGITRTDLADFDAFSHKVSKKMISLIKPDIDEKKRKLFTFIYESQGTLTVKELSEKAFWSSRQINRYFNQTFGISLHPEQISPGLFFR